MQLSIHLVERINSYMLCATPRKHPQISIFWGSSSGWKETAVTSKESVPCFLLPPVLRETGFLHPLLTTRRNGHLIPYSTNCFSIWNNLKHWLGLFKSRDSNRNTHHKDHFMQSSKDYRVQEFKGLQRITVLHWYLKFFLLHSKKDICPSILIPK